MHEDVRAEGGFVVGVAGVFAGFQGLEFLDIVSGEPAEDEAGFHPSAEGAVAQTVGGLNRVHVFNRTHCCGLVKLKCLGLRLEVTKDRKLRTERWPGMVFRSETPMTMGSKRLVLKRASSQGRAPLREGAELSVLR